MRIGIIAEGFADVNVIKAVVKKLSGLDGSYMSVLRPEDALDETDLHAKNFSNWELVFESCKDDDFLSAFFDEIDGEALLIVHVDTAERGMKGYDVNTLLRTGAMDYSEYAERLRCNVKQKIEGLIAPAYRDRVAYAIAVEETDAWLIPLFGHKGSDTASYARAKETLETKIHGNRKYIDTRHSSLDYVKLGKELAKSLASCRKMNRSLDLFCLEFEQRLPFDD